MKSLGALPTTLFPGPERSLSRPGISRSHRPSLPVTLTYSAPLLHLLGRGHSLGLWGGLPGSFSSCPFLFAYVFPLAAFTFSAFQG